MICTLTDYCRDEANDRAMLDILPESYDKVRIWLQGRDDLAYIRELGYADKLELPVIRREDVLTDLGNRINRPFETKNNSSLGKY